MSGWCPASISSIISLFLSAHIPVGIEVKDSKNSSYRNFSRHQNIGTLASTYSALGLAWVGEKLLSIEHRRSTQLHFNDRRAAARAAGENSNLEPITEAKWHCRLRWQRSESKSALDPKVAQERQRALTGRAQNSPLLKRQR